MRFLPHLNPAVPFTSLNMLVVASFPINDSITMCTTKCSIRPDHYYQSRHTLKKLPHLLEDVHLVEMVRLSGLSVLWKTGGKDTDDEDVSGPKQLIQAANPPLHTRGNGGSITAPLLRVMLSWTRLLATF